MITNTFSILQGIGEKIEKKLWEHGIFTWDDFIRANAISFISPEKKQWYNSMLEIARENLLKKEQTFFERWLNRRDHWRLFKAFRDAAVALDIETNGLPVSSGGYVTVVGLYNVFDYQALVKGNGLSRETLEHELSRYKYLITFFGSVFDLPFLRDALGINIFMPHFDLCFCGRRVGLKGGLKKVEEALSIYRDDSVKGFDGYDAVKLWADVQRGNSEALELLLKYNRCDTVNLFSLADIVYERLAAQTRIGDYFSIKNPSDISCNL